MKIKTLLKVLFPCIFLALNGYAVSEKCLWEKSFGGNNFDVALAIANDTKGNSYITGNFASDSIVFGNDTLIGSGQTDFYLVKYDEMGNVIWAKSAGGIYSESGNAIAVDSAGNVYVTGSFAGPSIIFGNDTLSKASFFIVAYDTSGNVRWARNAGTPLSGYGGTAIAVNNAGEIFVAGLFSDNSIIFGNDTLVNTNSNYSGDIFMVKYDTAGNVIWGKQMGSSDYDQPNGIACDRSGNVYLTGFFQDYSMTLDSSIILTNSGNADIFIAKFNSFGDVQWAKSSGGVNADYGESIAVDSSGNCYVTGYFRSTYIIFGNDTLSNVNPGPGYYSDMFLVKYDSSGNVSWDRHFGGNYYDYGYGVTTDNKQNVYIAGCFDSNSILVDTNDGQWDYFIGSGREETFIIMLDSSGKVTWGTQSTGGSYQNHKVCISVNKSGNAYVAGSFSDASMFFYGASPLTNVHLDTTSIYLAKLGTCISKLTVLPNTVPHNWYALNLATGLGPLTYLWTWGDGDTSYGATPSHLYSTPGNYNICLTVADSQGCTNTNCNGGTVYLHRSNNSNSIITISAILQMPVGVNETNANSIFVNTLPNPFNNEIIVKGTNRKGEIVVFDEWGREIIRKKTIADETKIETQNISAGFYLLKYIEGNESVNFKLMKL